MTKPPQPRAPGEPEPDSGQELSPDRELDAIVELVARLSPARRKALAQRLRVGGLLPAEPTTNDRNRLAKATALGKRVETGVETGQDAAPRTPTVRPGAPAGKAPATPAHTPGDTPADAAKRPGAAPLPLHFVGSGSSASTGSRRVGGKVVIGVPGAEPDPADPHAMPPLPGRAPEQPIGIIFDGGSKGNPGFGYGSYALRWPGLAQQIVQLQFGDHVTNNEAEYDTLAAALEAVLQRLRDGGADPTTARVDIRGDSQLVINQVTGEWKCNDERMRARRDRVRLLLREFGGWELAYHPRSNSVRVLGH